MAANRAVQMSVFVVRAFLKMRSLLGDKRDLAKQLAAFEGAQAAARCVRSGHRHHSSARDGHHRPAESATRAGQTEDRIQTVTDVRISRLSLRRITENN